MKRVDRLGEESYNKQGFLMKIIEYRASYDIDIMFEDGTILYNKTYQWFKQGAIPNPNAITIQGVGYLGVGKYNTRDENGINRHSKKYKTWTGMLERCYNKKYSSERPTYDNCTTEKDWYDFQNFAKWYDENYWECGKEKMCLDKDILFKGNKMYSPKTCCFVPNRINVLFTNRKNHRGLCPIGVKMSKNTKRYEVRCSTFLNNAIKNIYIGTYDTIEQAFCVYKEFKENYIKQVADEYKNKYTNFPKKLYDAMYRYEVDIND